MTCKYCGRELVDGVCPVCSKKSVEEKINDAYKNLGRQMSGKISVEEEERIKEEKRQAQLETKKEVQAIIKKEKEEREVNKEKARVEREVNKEKARVEILRKKDEYKKQKQEEIQNGTRLRVGLYPWLAFGVTMVLTVAVMLLTCLYKVEIDGGYYYPDRYEWIFLTETAIATIITGIISAATMFFLVMVLVNLVKRKKY